MRDTRLFLALEAGLYRVPDGCVHIWGAVGPQDLGPFAWSKTTVIQTFRPHIDRLEAAGLHARTRPNDRSALAVVFLPREKSAARARVAAAANATEGPVVIDGQKTDGIEPLLRALAKRADVSAPLSKAHGKIAVLAPGASLTDWADPGPARVDGFFTRAGVFSADGPDPASGLLAAALPANLKGRIADFGAGWGFLSHHILESPGVQSLDLIEAESTALECARLNVTDPRARFVWADATTHRDRDGYDGIVTNPPFHIGRDGDPNLGIAFIQNAARLLRPGGALWLVANRHLPYEKALAASFGDVAGIGGDRSFKLFRAARPR